MAVNVTLMATEAPVVVYFEDGSSVSANPQETKQFQVPSGSMCTISSTAGREENDEHMPPEPPELALAFAERMVATWQRLVNKARAEMRNSPQVNPVEVEVE